MKSGNPRCAQLYRTTAHGHIGQKERPCFFPCRKLLRGSKDMPNTQVIRCPSCGANNRVDRGKTEQGNDPVCGRCKKPLSLSNNKPLTVTDTSFTAEVEQSPLPVL